MLSRHTGLNLGNPMRFRRTLLLLLLALSATRFVACQSSFPQPPLTTQPQSALVEVDYPPPPARVEFMEAPPSNDAVWINGEWLWSGRRWSWRRGAWVVPPTRAAYARRVLVRREDGKLFFAAGTWRDATGAEVQVTAEKVNRSRSGAVVNPEGETEPTGADVQQDAGASDAGDARRAAPESGVDS